MEYVTYLNRNLQYLKLRLTHLVPHERVLVKTFLEKYSILYDSFDANVLVGTVDPPPPDLEEPYLQAYKFLASKKIDLVGYTPEEIHTFEVKLKGGHSFATQVLLYKELYEAAFHPTIPVIPCGICAYLDPDIDNYLKKFFTKIFVFKEHEHLLRT